ncbi:MAG: hypothetical protein PHO12_01020, partial [Bacteroidales bacterium]|nr:hypothetical protein [Bacteroidales bacterium]
MKKITLFILALGLTMGVMAQKANVSSTTLTSNLEVRQAEMKFGVKTDAAKTPSIFKPSAFNSCASTENPKLYTFNNDGDTLYLTGSNGAFFGFAQHYPVTATVTGVAAVLVKAYNGDDIATNVMLTNSDFTQTLATTTYQPAAIDGSAFAVYQYNFATPVANASNFNVAIRIPEYTQTSSDIILATTSVGCTSGLTRYIYFQDAWVDITTMFTTFDADFMLFPIVEGNVNGLNNVDVNSLTYVYPNPAKDQVMLASSFNMDKV